MRKTKLLLTLGSISSLVSLPMVAASCGKDTPRTENESGSNSTNETTNTNQTSNFIKVQSLDELREIITKIDLNDSESFEVEYVGLASNNESNQKDFMTLVLESFSDDKFNKKLEQSQYFNNLSKEKIQEEYTKLIQLVTTWLEILDTVKVEIEDTIKEFTAKIEELEVKLSSSTVENNPNNNESNSNDETNSNNSTENSSEDANTLAQYKTGLENLKNNLKYLKEDSIPNFIKIKESAQATSDEINNSVVLSNRAKYNYLLNLANTIQQNYQLFRVGYNIVIDRSEEDFGNTINQILSWYQLMNNFKNINSLSNYVLNEASSEKLEKYSSLYNGVSLRERAQVVNSLDVEEISSNQFEDAILKLMLELRRFIFFENSENGIVLPEWWYEFIVSDLKFNPAPIKVELPITNSNNETNSESNSTEEVTITPNISFDKNIYNQLTIYTLNQNNKLDSVFSDEETDYLNVNPISSTNESTLANSETESLNSEDSSTNEETNSNTTKNPESSTNEESSSNDENSETSSNEITSASEPLLTPIKLSSILNVNNLSNSVFLKVPLPTDNLPNGAIGQIAFFIQDVEISKSEDGQKAKLKLKVFYTPNLNLNLNTNSRINVNAFIKLKFSN